ncbi:hypothetical protein Hypma_007484 [Hypsizygus marmoreus]|uniref:Uncharacterized protein n=1 Tax=Hypsizygus marmoreus TaxID=39966 RepID=A0A369JUK9_HYPMA|nr:hypothetical protein Hypma_007484 [Hypsizygus marmoreus]
MSSSPAPAAETPVSGIFSQPPTYIIISVSVVAGVLCLIVTIAFLWIRASRIRRLRDDIEGGDPRKTPRKGFFYSSRSSREASESHPPSRPQTPPPAYIPDSPCPMLPECPVYTPSATPVTTGDQGYPVSPFGPLTQESGSPSISRDPPARRATS